MLSLFCPNPLELPPEPEAPSSNLGSPAIIPKKISKLIINLPNFDLGSLKICDIQGSKVKFSLDPIRKIEFLTLETGTRQNDLLEEAIKDLLTIREQEVS